MVELIIFVFITVILFLLEMQKTTLRKMISKRFLHLDYFLIFFSLNKSKKILKKQKQRKLKEQQITVVQILIYLRIQEQALQVLRKKSPKKILKYLTNTNQSLTWTNTSFATQIKISLSMKFSVNTEQSGDQLSTRSQKTLQILKN